MDVLPIVLDWDHRSPDGAKRNPGFAYSAAVTGALLPAPYFWSM
jgi:hypothetical protein